MEIKTKDARGLLFVLFLGQLVAFSLAAGNFASSLIANLGVNTPLTQSFFVYLLLTLVYVPILIHRRQKPRGNYMFVEAYQYSSITSITLLDCWTIVWVIILTWYVLGTRYSFWQFLGAGTCVAGLCLVLLSDAKSADVQDPGKTPLLGDALVIAGTICYAFTNIGQISMYAGYAAAMFMFYTITPFVLKMSGSTLFNLSLLTSDMRAVAIRVFLYQQQVNWLYYLAFAIVAIGLIIYSLNESSSGDGTAASTEAVAQYQQLPSEDNPTGSGSNLDRQERKQHEEADIC